MLLRISRYPRLPAGMRGLVDEEGAEEEDGVEEAGEVAVDRVQRRLSM